MRLTIFAVVLTALLAVPTTCLSPVNDEPWMITRGTDLHYMTGHLEPSIPTWEAPGWCSLRLCTRGGGSCHVSVECNGQITPYETSDACYIGGENHFSDPNIGKFSVCWKGIEDETLEYPVLRMETLLDPVDVFQLARD